MFADRDTVDKILVVNPRQIRIRTKIEATSALALRGLFQFLPFHSVKRASITSSALAEIGWFQNDLSWVETGASNSTAVGTFFELPSWAPQRGVFLSPEPLQRDTSPLRHCIRWHNVTEREPAQGRASVSICCLQSTVLCVQTHSEVNHSKYIAYWPSCPHSSHLSGPIPSPQWLLSTMLEWACQISTAACLCSDGFIFECAVRAVSLLQLFSSRTLGCQLQTI